MGKLYRTTRQKIQVYHALISQYKEHTRHVTTQEHARANISVLKFYLVKPVYQKVSKISNVKSTVMYKG